MGIERTLINQKGKECLELASETKNSKSRKSRRRQRKMSQVQKLYDICKEVFATGGPDIIPPADDIQRLKSVLDGMTERDVGLSPNMSCFGRTTTDQLPRITYLHLHECDKFSYGIYFDFGLCEVWGKEGRKKWFCFGAAIGIFCLPPSAVLPLHNHPGMTVFSKLLFGTMHIKSYDWAVDVTSDANPPGVRLAKVQVNSDFTAPNTSILYPADGGNMHCFTALTPCAVLDVLGPPYCDPEGRHCAYYLDFPFSSFSGGEDVDSGQEKVDEGFQESLLCDPNPNPSPNAGFPFFSFQSMLSDPNANSPANSEAALLFSENKCEYNRRVREIVEQSWTED
ncbi:hypothetical protein TEA_023085 [Camellia sinensis var. sinensis]|uniref:cysteine dioxygenase n=1 Tax=Camellia sinensis var. sinensis TaxID=542762 RepID=A0A4S4DD57_CAMSN|nr:hypothetical protein TEA_023085 [Camellia sinensis var. sinensis]